MGKTTKPKKKKMTRADILDLPKGVRMSIVDVKIDYLKQVAIVSVRIRYDGKEWFKPFRITTSELVEFDEFFGRVEDSVARDFTIDKNLAEITQRKKRSFVLFKK